MRGRQRTKREIEQRQSGSSSSTWSQHRWRGDAIWRRARIIDMGGGGFGRQRGGLLLQCCFSFVTTRRHMEVESMAGKTVVRWIWPTAMADPAGHRYSWPHGRVERVSLWSGPLVQHLFDLSSAAHTTHIGPKSTHMQHAQSGTEDVVAFNLHKQLVHPPPPTPALFSLPPSPPPSRPPKLASHGSAFDHL